MDLFTTTTQIFVLSMIGSTFAAMAALSILDSIADHKTLVAGFRAATNPVSRRVAR
ncbi:hypothetical protein [Stenotrophobium rhamnosiphilum]|uniref:hypothetical protein n=1 Tax=Stenotrophobium rhamnosiphilum TaxID=2029166 RepID=UPI001374FEEB|nr:hypothetical protein [Stenotrophobium rhamnosiphilum]